MERQAERTMCLLVNQTAPKIFGRQNHDTGRISPYLNRIMGPDFSGYLQDRDEHRRQLEQLPFETWTIAATDGTLLKAHFYYNPESAHRTAILIHGHGSCGFEGYASIGLEYISQGYSILLPDSRACGQSGGQWCTFGLLESRDLGLWIDETVRRYPQDQLILQGVSLGGATVCMSMAQELPPAVRCAVSDCAFADGREQIGHMIRTAHLPVFPLLKELGIWFHRHTGLQLEECRPLAAVAQAKIPMLFVHGALDQYVPCDNARRLYEACGSEKELHLFEGAGHAASHYFHRGEYNRTVFQFLERHLEAE
jgi:pimeloyl-ACP methyl ester carboxylesterase